jgi:hypothetical protein
MSNNKAAFSLRSVLLSPPKNSTVLSVHQVIPVTNRGIITGLGFAPLLDERPVFNVPFRFTDRVLTRNMDTPRLVNLRVQRSRLDGIDRKYERKECHKMRANV